MAIISLLMAVLVAALAFFAVTHVRQAMRTRLLSRLSSQLNLRFSADDPFDVPRRYADFTLIGSGHSPQASNVMHGRLEQLPVQAFDYRYEIGHGTRRATRHYQVVAIEIERKLPALVMWSDEDPESVPLAAQLRDGHIAAWSYRGNGELARAVKDACGSVFGGSVSLEVGGQTFMVFRPVKRRQNNLAARLREVAEAVRAVQSHPLLSAPAGPA